MYWKSKGISPLIAAVLLMGFTMAVASLSMPFFSNTIQSIQEDTSQDTVNVQRASQLGLEITGVEFNRSADKLEVTIQNTGEDINNKTNVSVKVNGGDIAKNKVYDHDLSTKEIKTVKLPLDQTYPLETIQVGLTKYSVSTESGIKCTPTENLVGYWTFNDEQTQNGWSVDLSGYGNNGSLNNGVSSGSSSLIGESYKYDGGGDTVKISNDNTLQITGDLTLSIMAKFDSSQYDNDTSRWDFIAKDHNDEYRFAAFETKQILWHGNNTDYIGEVFKPSNIGGYLDDKWHHLVVVRDNSRQNVTAYMDGKKVPYGYGDPWIEPEKGSDNIHVGSWQGDAGVRNFKGKLDEPRIYNRSLSQKEIKRLYNIRSEKWVVDVCKLTG